LIFRGMAFFLLAPFFLLRYLYLGFIFGYQRPM
jgi:hypothetical protein